ncbi:5469_t:CDS:2 [Diversispora eburnea]|uniref:5469_t:CDS:1 n=1 Tax=Diversispora eburnea TaxID=1213867 RepID=A0A9N8VKM5_9GLOM|nr:5469_t:CDS:2 [Diversispora eburnea]
MSSISKRGRSDYFNRTTPPPSSSVSDTEHLLQPKNNELPQYYSKDRYVGRGVGIRNGEIGGGELYFNNPFLLHQNLIMRERFIRRTLSFIILALIIIFLTYVWFSPLGTLRYSNHHHHHHHDPSPPSSPQHDNKNNNDRYRQYYNYNPYHHQSSNEEIHLYRILGNDLPPRHKPGQVLQNLRFVLENESHFYNTKKWWILNRIVDSDYEDAILALLRRHNQDYIRIPFEEEEYLKRDFRLEDFPEPDFFHSYEYMNFSKVAKLRTIDFTYHYKNLYAMNNNAGRNAALQHGQSQPNAKWIMPFDGNCFLTVNGFKEIIQQLEKWGKDYKYFVVPMTRLLNNTHLLVEPDKKPPTPEEKYNEDMRYGRRSKLEMLWRLGVETSPFNRLLAIQDFLDGIDERIARINQGFDSNRLSLYNEKLLNAARLDYWSGNPEIEKIVNIMIEKANGISLYISKLYKKSDNSPFHIKNDLLPEGFQRDVFGQYIFNSPISIPNVSTSLLFENITTLTLAYHFSGDSQYSLWAANLIRTFILSSYGVSEQDELTVTSYKDDLDAVNDEGYGFPHLNKIPRMIPKFFEKPPQKNNNESSTLLFPYDLIDTDPSHFLDACRLLYKSNTLTHKEYIDLQQFASRWLEYLINSPEGISRARRPDHQGTLYDLQVLSLSGFTNDVRLYLRISNRLRMRIGKQFHISNDVSSLPTKISQPYESIYVNKQFEKIKGYKIDESKIKEDFLIYENEKFKYSNLNLQYWMLITRVIQNAEIGNDLWNYKSKKVLRFSKIVMEHLNEFSNRNSKFEYFSNLNYNDDHISNSNHNSSKNVDIIEENHVMEIMDMNDILKPLVYKAQAAHECNDKKLGISHEYGDEHDYFRQYLNKFSDKIDLAKGTTGSSDPGNVIATEKLKRDKLDLQLGLGKKSREWGIPPFWMFGIA